MKPFKTVKIEYYEEGVDVFQPIKSRRDKHSRRIKVVTTTEHWVGSSRDPIISTAYEYL
jgi:hypothetical protein